MILSQIAAQPQITAKDLAAELGVTKGAISQQLTVLEHEGFIVRRRSEHDHRVQVLELIGNGATYRDSLQRYDEELAERFDRTLSAAEIAQIVSALQKLTRIFAD